MKLLQSRYTGNTALFPWRHDRLLAHILRQAAILHQARQACHIFPYALTSSLWIQPFCENRDERIRGKESRDGVCTPFVHGAFHIILKLKCSDFFCGNRISISVPAPYEHWGVGYEVCATWKSEIPLFRHTACSTSSMRLWICDISGRQMKCPLFPDTTLQNLLLS